MTTTHRYWPVALAGLAAGYWIYRRAQALDLHGRVALVTGGSRGLGLAMARELARHGANLALVARDDDELTRAAKTLAPFGVDVQTFACDVTDKDKVKQCAQRVVERMGRVDVLVNNAGQIQVGPLRDMTEADFDNALDVHVKGPLQLMFALIPSMRARGEGRIVNIASFGGVIAVPHMAPYSASKFALLGLSDAVRTELALDGIKVTTVCPGLMRTGSHRNAQFKGQAEKEYDWFTLANGWPIISVDADVAARKIVQAMRLGQPRLDITVPARAGRIAAGLAPNLLARSLVVATRLLPKSAQSRQGRRLHAGSEFARSKESEQEAQAAVDNNEQL